MTLNLQNVYNTNSLMTFWTGKKLYIEKNDIILFTCHKKKYLRKIVKSVDDDIFNDIQNRDFSIFEQIKPQQKRKLHIIFQKDTIIEDILEEDILNDVINDFVHQVKLFYDIHFGEKIGYWEISRDVLVQQNEHIISILFVETSFKNAYEMQSFWDDFQQEMIRPSELFPYAKTTYDLDASVEFPLFRQWSMEPIVFTPSSENPRDYLVGIYE